MRMRSVECGIPKDSAFIMYAFDSISLCSLVFSFGYISWTSSEVKNLVILNYCQKELTFRSHMLAVQIFPRQTFLFQCES